MVVGPSVNPCSQHYLNGACFLCTHSCAVPGPFLLCPTLTVSTPIDDLNLTDINNSGTAGIRFIETVGTASTSTHGSIVGSSNWLGHQQVCTPMVLGILS